MNPEGRWYPALLAGLALLCLAGGSILTVVMLATVIGPFSVDALRLTEPDPGPRLGLWTPPSALALPEAEPTALDRAWRAAFPESLRIAASGRLQALVEAGAPVIAVTDARALSDAEQRALELFALRGGHVLLAGWVGVWSGNGAWLGTERMRRLLDVPRIATLPYQDAFFLAAGERGPLSAGLDPARRIVLPRAFEAPAIPNESAELAWVDWRLAPRAPAAGASLRRGLGRGTLVWLASPPFEGSDTAGADALRRVYGNALAWLERRATHELLAWPERAPFAGLLALDTEHAFEHAHEVAALSRRHDVPVTYMVVSAIAERHSAVFEELVRSGEIGSHGDIHDGFAGVPLDTQKERITRSLDQLQELGTERPIGFRAPYESADDQTLRAMRLAGVEYVLGDPELFSQAPRLAEPAPGLPLLVRIPRAVADDVELIERRGLVDPTQIWEALRADLDRTERTGGLYYLSLHTQHLARPEYRMPLARVMRELRARGAWLPSGRELAHWWRARSQVQTALDQSNPRRLALDVTNQGRHPVRGLVVRLHFNRPVDAVSASSALAFSEAPGLVHASGALEADLALPEIPARQSRRFTLDLTLDVSSGRAPSPRE